MYLINSDVIDRYFAGAAGRNIHRAWHQPLRAAWASLHGHTFDTPEALIAAVDDATPPALKGMFLHHKIGVTTDASGAQVPRPSPEAHWVSAPLPKWRGLGALLIRCARTGN